MANQRLWAVGWGACVWLLGCAGAAAEAPSQPVAPAPPRQAKLLDSAAQLTAAQTQPAPETVAEPAEVTTRELPTSCADKSACFPPAAFVDAVCKKKFPDLPLHLFAARAPWQHQYVKAEHVEPVNPYGGEQSEAWMQFGEEVVVLRRRGGSGGKGVQVSGPSDVDVLRWDGTCATIRQEMLVSYVPAPMQSPRVIWKYLDSDLQQALLTNAVVARARDAEKKACKASSHSHPTEACAKAMQKLTDAIALAVHQNIELPSTGNTPAWVK